MSMQRSQPASLCYHVRTPATSHLHHALEARGRLEGGLGRIGVLGVDELGDDAARAVQLLHVRRQLQHQLVDVACDSWGRRAGPSNTARGATGDLG